MSLQDITTNIPPSHFCWKKNYKRFILKEGYYFYCWGRFNINKFVKLIWYQCISIHVIKGIQKLFILALNFVFFHNLDRELEGGKSNFEFPLFFSERQSAMRWVIPYVSGSQTFLVEWRTKLWESLPYVLVLKQTIASAFLRRDVICVCLLIFFSFSFFKHSFN